MNSINYPLLINKAMLGIIRDVLKKLQKKSFHGFECFYVSFLIEEGVILSKTLRKKHQKELMIVLQDQYQNLEVLKNKFIVSLYFDNILETIEVPFKSITYFADPAYNFVLQFKQDSGINSSAFYEKKLESKHICRKNYKDPLQKKISCAKIIDFYSYER